MGKNITNNDIMLAIQELAGEVKNLDTRITAIENDRVLNAPVFATYEKVEKNCLWEKEDGTQIPCSQKEYDYWMSQKQKREAKKFGGFTDEHKEWVIAHPLCSRKDFADAFDCSGVTKELLKKFKAQLRAGSL